MKKLFVSLFAVFLSFGFFAAEADARRFGGGGSFGMQRSAPVQRSAPAPAPKQPAAATNPAGRSGMWGAIGGLAAGLGLAALFSHLGFGEEMGSFILIALLVFAAVLIFRRLTRGAAAPGSSNHMAYAGNAPGADTPARQGAAVASGGGVQAHDDFDDVAFARQAKLNFIRLQTAYDEGNLEDIRSFTAPEVFAEVRMQLEERGGAAQKTDVIELDAEVIEVTTEANRYVVSVRFTGLIREEADTPPAAFDEIWHLTKPVDGDAGWVISGIQQSH